MKHCNRANVWGVLDKYKEKSTEENGRPYLEVFIDCRHNTYGSVRVLGFIWGKAGVEDFKANFTRGDELRFSGGIQQYAGRKKVTRTTFNFYILKPGPVKEYKAAFILVGDVVSLEGETLEILIKNEYRSDVQKGNRSGTQKGNKSDVQKGNRSGFQPDTFKIHLPRDVLLDLNKTPESGQTISAKGYIIHPEDEFGDATGPQQPVIKELKFL
ncbi:MAG: hypothetical protein GY774_16425 [Planctomycetes bacterium]|nr:hypothetical protein [Planctomycetota bacterium]